MNLMWWIVASLAAVAVLAAGFAVQQYLVRRRAARSPLPPLCTSDDHHAESDLPARQVLSRDALVNRNRTLNVHAWDNTPDSSPPTDLDGVVDEAMGEPMVIDRSFLAERRRPGTNS